jgi:hypothetical protein
VIVNVPVIISGLFEARAEVVDEEYNDCSSEAGSLKPKEDPKA